MVGPQVKIVRGDLENLEAEVMGVTAEGKVMAVPKIANFREEVPFEPDELAKVFEVGREGGGEGGKRGARERGLVDCCSSACFPCLPPPQYRPSTPP